MRKKTKMRTTMIRLTSRLLKKSITDADAQVEKMQRFLLKNGFERMRPPEDFYPPSSKINEDLSFIRVWLDDDDEYPTPRWKAMGGGGNYSYLLESGDTYSSLVVYYESLDKGEHEEEDDDQTDL
jgi:hypothetical protein